MRNQCILIGVVVLFLPAIALSQTDVQDGAKQELQEQFDSYVEFMQTGDIERLKEFYPEDHTSMELSRGVISEQNYAGLAKMMQGYFNDVEYKEFEDIEGPFINVSPDGKMAWIMRSMRIGYKLKKSGMESSLRATGIDVMEKRDGKWLEVASSAEYKFDRMPVAVEQPLLEEYAGSYYLALQDATFHAEIEDGRLQLRGPSRTVKCAADTPYSFHLEDDSADLVFIRNSEGAVSHMLLVANGGTVALPRVED